MKRTSKKETGSKADDERRESGMPGGGQGRRDDVGQSGVYPMSGGLPPGKHPEVRTMAGWGQGERGAEGYEDSGGSELVMREGQVLGGLTSGPSGEPTIDIHGGDRPEKYTSAEPSGQSPDTTSSESERSEQTKRGKGSSRQ